MGLVREPLVSVQAPDRTVQAKSPEAQTSVQSPAQARTPPRERVAAVNPQAPPPLAALPAPYAPPDRPGACPSAAEVAACTSLADLQKATEGCLACPLGPGRLKFVFGEGAPKARLMFVGEGPGRDEDLQGRPFVGKAGELLDKMIGALGLRREDTYIANVVKCRPPDNRTPTSEEAKACLGFLHRQIELVQPAVLVTLGATPLRELVGVSEGVTKVRGQWRRVTVGGREIPVMPTFHPAYVLRQYTQDVRRAVWADLQAAKAWIDRPE